MKSLVATWRLKVLAESFAGDKERLLRFEKEAEAAGTLNHPNILAVYDVGTHDGHLTWFPSYSKAKSARALNGTPSHGEGN